MIRTIARKEFLTSLLTYRFAFAFAACALLMGLSAYALADDYARRLDVHQAELLREENKLKEIKVYAQLKLYTHRPPSPLSIFSEGLEKRLGNLLHFSHSHVPTMLSWRKENNPLMDAFPAFDLATIAQLLFSLMALVFAYDAVCGEHEAGTLKLMAANAVARYQVLIGKWLGGLLCILLPALAGFLLALLILVNAPQIHFTADEWLQVGLIVGAACVYTSLFYLIGLCLSVRARLPSTSLVLAILIWTLTTIVLPTTTAYLVGEVLPMRTEQTAREARESAEQRFRREFDHIHEIQRQGFGSSYHIDGRSPLGAYMWGSGLYRDAVSEIQAFYAETEPQRIKAAEEIARLEDRVIVDRIAQVELDRTLGRGFITSAFSGVTAVLAGTDLTSYQDFIRHARRCRQGLVDFLQERDIFSSPLFFTRDRVENLLTRAEYEIQREKGQFVPFKGMDEWEPLDLSMIPRFPEYRTTFSTGLSRATTDLGILVLANVVLLLLALRWFLRRELT